MKLKAPVGSVLREGAVSLQLKQTGDAVTGQAATDDDNSQEVQDGKAEGNTLTFHVTPDDGPPIQVKLTLAGGELAGEARGEVEGQKVVAELKFQRQ